MKFFAQASVQKIPAKIFLGYLSVQIVIKRSVLLYKSLSKGKSGSAKSR